MGRLFERGTRPKSKVVQGPLPKLLTKDELADTIDSEDGPRIRIPFVSFS